MSLLLEALKKAEQAKREAEGPPPAGTPGSPAEPPAASALDIASAEPSLSYDTPETPPVETRQEPVITRASLPDINQPLEIDPGDFARATKREPPAPEAAPGAAPQSAGMFVSGGAEPPPSREAAADFQQPARDAARQLFDVKEIDYNPRRPFYITVGVLAAAGIGYGGYVWWQMQPRTMVNTAAVQSAPKTPPPAPAPAPAAIAEASEAPQPAQPAPGSAPAPAPATVRGPQAAAPGTPVPGPAATGARESSGAIPATGARPQAAPAPQPARAAAAPAAAAPAAAAPAAAAPATAAAPRAPALPARAAPARPSAASQRAAIPAQTAAPAPITVTPPTLQRDEGLDRAYADFQRGDLAASREGYERVLTREPNSRDALLGLAAIDVRLRSFETAYMRYQRLIELDPRDAAAQAGLVALTASADPVQAESRLKTMIASQSDSAPQLQFVLGNQYAAQGRWSEAQEAYFKAYGGDEGNPDYAFNLAVSLDQLRQSRLALEYYRRALALAGTRVAAFDLAGAQARVRELER